MISPERQTHFAHLIVDGVWKSDMVDYPQEERALTIAKRAVAAFSQEIDSLDDNVRQKLYSMKRVVVEGSSEWDALYGKFFEEELRKRGL